MTTTCGATILECVYCRKPAICISYGMSICDQGVCVQKATELPRALALTLAEVAVKTGAPYSGGLLRDVAP